VQFRPFSEYSKAYSMVDIQREEGILELRLHSGDGPLSWGQETQGQLVNLYTEIALDPDNELVILTGTGDAFVNAWEPTRVEPDEGKYRRRVEERGSSEHLPKRLISSLLEIEVPMIAAVNGPVALHAEQAFLCDIVLAAETATFRDAAHFPAGLIPGDGIFVAYSESVGLNRARYLMLTGLALSAQRAYEWGLVNEVLPLALLMPRARELAKMIQEQPPLVRRHTRQLLIHNLRKRMVDEVSYGVAIEHLAATESYPQGLAPLDSRVS
jgi:enoyl-CoA hydratase/carnithine racemase